MIAAAPRDVPGRADRLLLNLAALSQYAGDRLELDYATDHVLSYSRHGGETAFLMEHLIAAGLVDREPGAYAVVAVSVQGWGRVGTLRSPGTSYRQAFVAMSFEDDLLPLYDAAIGPAIRAAGFDPFVIAAHEDTGQIDDRILLELNRSRFIVADFTGHRPNVYFEAGYALGRGLPVIWTCRQDYIEEAHFDTRQYNHLVWSDAEDLRERLHRRIEVVVA
jgi:nucleoside 2-deoxyribosyltransferase